MRISLYECYEQRLIRLAEDAGVSPSAYVKQYILEQYESKFGNDPLEVVRKENEKAGRNRAR